MKASSIMPPLRYFTSQGPAGAISALSLASIESVSARMAAAVCSRVSAIRISSARIVSNPGVAVSTRERVKARRSQTQDSVA